MGSEAYCAPLCHESSSGESLQINIHTGRWNCKACKDLGVHGDLFQLVEYALSNGDAPSHGKGQRESAGHRSAIEWLCGQFGIPYDSDRVTGDGGLDVIHTFAMLAHQHLLSKPSVLEWIEEKWGFDLATVESYGLGFMPSPILPELLSESSQVGSKRSFKSSGVGWYSPDGCWHTHFEGRVIFPYLEGGRAVYMIGRQTPWTPKPEEGGRSPKYHKLSVHSERRPYISERVTNDHLWNEPVMSTADEVGILEGIADGVAGSALGLAVVSPVTVSFNEADLERFLRKCKENGINRVWILFDNELSGSGIAGAQRLGLKLVRGGLCVSILTLPLGPVQQAAKDELLEALGKENLATLESSEPRDRKRLIAELFPEPARRAWILEQVETTKIDFAEWSALEGAGAAGKFNAIRKAGRDVIDVVIEEALAGLEDGAEIHERSAAFNEAVDLAAHINDRLSRGVYASKIAKAAGKGITKVDIASRIAGIRRDKVTPKQKEEAKREKISPEAIQRELVLLPPEPLHVRPQAPEQKDKPDSGRPAAPSLPKPGANSKSDHDRYQPARIAVAKAVEAKFPEETIGEYVSQTILRSMGFTAFQTLDDLFLVRGSQSIRVSAGLSAKEFTTLLFLSSGLMPSKSSHKGYISASIYFLGKNARRVSGVAWSHVDESGAVFFPTGDAVGNLLKIEPGFVTETKMSVVKVPAVCGRDFLPFDYVEGRNGIDRALEIFRWISLSKGDRLVLTYWLVCLPVLRRIGTVPIVRIEGGSSSGKTRAVEAVSRLVNGQKSSSVPSAAALVSCLSSDMLTIDDNRESRDMTPSFLGTLLQATHLGARKKRANNTDTGTVVERVSGALLMNGIEPIHDGHSELASRMLTLGCSINYRGADSPRSEQALFDAIDKVRSAFWSEAPRRCAGALRLDAEFGEQVGQKIEDVFGDTRIGRLSSYLRIMYFSWVAGFPGEAQAERCEDLDLVWVEAFRSIAANTMESLIREELSVTVLRYVFAHGSALAVAVAGSPDQKLAFDEKFLINGESGETFLGPVKASKLAALARMAGKELNAPRSITYDLRAGQLEKRLIDGIPFLEAAGFEVDIETTKRGVHRFTFRRLHAPAPPTNGLPGDWQGDTWAETPD